MTLTILVIVVYFLIGLGLARFAAVYIDEKNKLNKRLVTWHEEFGTTLLVISLPLVWPLTPLLLLGKVGKIVTGKTDGMISYLAKELANPKDNV